MMVRELMRALKKAKPEAIVTVMVDAFGGSVAITAIDEATCTKNVVEENGAITEQQADCLIFYNAELERHAEATR